MLRSRRARSRRAALEAARRTDDGGDWRSARGEGSGQLARAAVLVAVGLGLLGIGFALGWWSARRGEGAGRLQAAAEAPAPAERGVDLVAAVASAAAPAPASLDSGSAAGDAAHLDPSLDLPAAAPGASAIAIVIDDLGRSVEVIDQLHAIGVALTYAVLPFEPRTAEVAARLDALDEEVLCHLPMEAQRGENPGQGALTEAMDVQQIRDATSRALDAVPGAAGVNNHMGSALSEDRAKMSAVLDVVRERGLFFLDSRTSAASVGFAVAREAGIPAAERKVFLDDDRTPAAIRHQLRRLLAMANRGEPAIAIGHPYPETIAVLVEEMPRAKEKGYELVRVSDVVSGEHAAASLP
jgi:polysaccharide deacetylase 2 family uncharacterized protein YibQ